MDFDKIIADAQLEKLHERWLWTSRDFDAIIGRATYIKFVFWRTNLITDQETVTFEWPWARSTEKTEAV